MHALSLAQYAWRPQDVPMRLTVAGDGQALMTGFVGMRLNPKP
jgi:hypothetical protein